MDDRRFDSLAKTLATGKSRRSVVKGLLGLGGAAVIGSTGLDHEAEAARRSLPTPTPVRCPGQQVAGPGGVCACPGDLRTCGPDCCNDQVPVTDPQWSGCCEQACCSYPNDCVAEERCCPRLPEVACLDTAGNCCATICQSASHGMTCCSEADFCPGGAQSAGLCCAGPTTCCGGGTNDNHCIPANQTCCNHDADCAHLDTCDGLTWHHAICGIDGYCVDTPQSCGDDSRCTTDTCDARTGCGHAEIVCTTPPVCFTGPGTCNADTGQCDYIPSVCDTPGACEASPGVCNPETGQCEYPARCSGNTPQCCQSGDGTAYCIGSTQICCENNETCSAPCTHCGPDGYCESACANMEACCDADCVDLLTDPNNCGVCGTVCTGCATCSGGICVPDDQNCSGTCGICGLDGTCSAGACGRCEICVQDSDTGAFQCQPDPTCCPPYTASSDSGCVNPCDANPCPGCWCVARADGSSFCAANAANAGWCTGPDFDCPSGFECLYSGLSNMLFCLEILQGC